MTHFLGRLVERARGTASRVEPIIAPRFAPVPVTEITTAVESPPPPRREPSEKEAATASNGLVVRREGPATREPDERLAEQTGEAAPQKLLVPSERPGTEVVQRPGWTRRGESVRRDVLSHVQSAAAKAVVRRANPHHPRPAIPQPSHRPAVSAHSLTLPNESASNERPIVRVTIGRIEVRAAPAPAARARKPPQAPGPKLTLDDYLKSRKEGAR